MKAFFQFITYFIVFFIICLCVIALSGISLTEPSSNRQQVVLFTAYGSFVVAVLSIMFNSSDI